MITTITVHDNYGTAQRQLDTHMRAAACSGEDYIMRSIFEWVPVMFVPASGKSSGMYTCERCSFLNKLFTEA